MADHVLTKQQQKILILLTRFRVLDTKHIQAFLHHKQKQQINRWMTDLTKKQYVQREYDEGIVGRNRVAARYTIDLNGIRWVRAQGIYDTQSLRKLYYDGNRSESFINHCLLLATICCELEQKQNETVGYEYATQSDFSNPNHPFSFLIDSELSIDLVVTKKRGRKIQLYLVTIIGTTFPRYRIRKRLRNLLNFSLDGTWEDNIATQFPSLLIICETKERLIYAKRYARSIIQEQEDEIAMHFATAQDVRRYGFTDEIWEKA